MTHLPIPAVNFHLVEPCNMRCKFCFATFKDVKHTILPKGHLPRLDCLALVEQIARPNMKITFAGGEPTLCPWLADAVHTAKAQGATTMIVTNGARITDEYLAGFGESLDWIALSIDSLCDATNLASGRAIAGRRVLTELDYYRLVDCIKRAGIRYKLNTTVYALNWQEDMSKFVLATRPERWKLFQVLSVEGQNDQHFSSFAITAAEFDSFCRKHGTVTPHVSIVPEPNEKMRGSYLMIDPAGRFYDSTNGGHTYSAPILEVGIEKALKQISIDEALFKRRGGEWQW